MTNKMPVVGKRYRDKENHNVITTFIGTYENKLVYAQHQVDYKGRAIITPNTAYFCELNNFWEWFEEIPEHNANANKKAEELEELQARIEKLEKLLEINNE